MSGDEGEVQRLLDNGANPNAIGENGNSVLMVAAEKGNQYFLLGIAAKTFVRLKFG